MSCQDNTEIAKAKLDESARKVLQSFEEDAGEIGEVLRIFFKDIYEVSVSNLLSDEDMADWLTFWNQNVLLLYHIHPDDAFHTVTESFDLCSQQSQKYHSQKLIVSMLCESINAYTRPALQFMIMEKQAFTHQDAMPYLFALKNVIMTTSPHEDSLDLQDIFFQALSEFEKILYSCFISPVIRFDQLTFLKEWAEKNPYPCTALLVRTDELLAQATYLPNGQGEVLHSLEVRANNIAKETQNFKENSVSDIQSAFAIRAGVMAECVDLYNRIETAFKNENFDEAEEGLYDLFLQLSADQEDENISQKEISTLSYWMTSASKLHDKSMINSFNLAYRCIIEIENQVIASEYLKAAVYRFSLPVILGLETQDRTLEHRAVDVYKIIMKQSSEFTTSDDIQKIFEDAAIRFREFLGRISPVARYNEVSELETWLESRKSPSPYLQDFVDDLMNSSQFYGNDRGIPLEEDTFPSIHGVSHPFP